MLQIMHNAKVRPRTLLMAVSQQLQVFVTVQGHMLKSHSMIQLCSMWYAVATLNTASTAVAVWRLPRRILHCTQLCAAETLRWKLLQLIRITLVW